MLKNNEIKNTPQIIISAGDKKYNVHLTEIASFFEDCSTFHLTDLDAIDFELDKINTMVIDGAEDNIRVSEIKGSLKLMRQLKYLFNSGFSEAD